MLQALKLDAPTTAPPRSREPEPEISGLEPGFAAYLAQATGWIPAPPAAAPTVPEAAKSTESPSRNPRLPVERAEAQGQGPDPRPTAVRDTGSQAPETPARSAESTQMAVPEGDAPSSVPPESPAGTPGAPEGKETSAPLNRVPDEKGNAAVPAGAVLQAAVEAAPGIAPRVPTRASRLEGEPGLAKAPTLASPRPAEDLGLNLRVEPEAARTWSATGTALRPLQEFLAQPRPPLETPAPLREAPPAQAPAPPAQNPGEGQHGTPAPTTASQTSPEGSPTGAPLLQQATLAGRTPLTNRTLATGTALPTTPMTGAVAVSAVQAPEASQTLSQPRVTMPALQVEGSIRWMIQNRQRGAELHLHPESLGRVTIRLTVEGTEVHARVWASEASTLPLLQEHRTHLEQALRDQGLSLGSFDLNQGSRGDASPEPHKPQTGPTALPAADSGSPQQELPTQGTVLPGGARLLEVFA